MKDEMIAAAKARYAELKNDRDVVASVTAYVDAGLRAKMMSELKTAMEAEQDLSKRRELKDNLDTLKKGGGMVPPIMRQGQVAAILTIMAFADVEAHDQTFSKAVENYGTTEAKLVVPPEGLVLG